MGKNEMTETPIPEQVTKLTEYVRGCVKLIEGGTLNNIGVLNQEACIGQNGSSIVAALDALIKDNTDLKASVTLFRKCYKAAAEIWRKDNPERSEFFYPSGEKAIAAMIAEHSFWEKGSMTEFAQRNMELKERITEMKAGLDHIIKWSKQSQELLGKGQLMRAVRRMCYDTLGKGE